MKLNIRNIDESEIKYTYQNNRQINAETGFIGKLRGDFGSDGNEFWTSWEDGIVNLKTDEFNNEFDDVVNYLRSDDNGLLKSRSTMEKYINNNREYGFRVDTQNNTYLLRCHPLPSNYNFYVYCFNKQYFNEHLRKASKGIRFVDTHYKELFRIPDGEEITIKWGDGKVENKKCRYIDNYHTLVGGVLFHISEFADVMESSKSSCEPKDVNKVIKKNIEYQR